ncbi:MAG: microcystin degradation protein MlrC [Rhodospirillaceae bacterium]|nr:microcystin degradation protein MlrC [Rhodospirillaceae bacterium]
MRLVIAMMSHETNTFSTVPTPLSRFSRGNTFPIPLEGEEVAVAYRDTGTAVGAFIQLAEKEGAEISFPIAAGAWPSGPVDDEAYVYMTDKICGAVEAGCDGVLLQLHGAMVTQSLEDGEGALLLRLRAIAPEIRIAVSLDMHTNMYPAIVENADIVAGYQTYPHIDVYETGLRVGRAFFGMIRGDTSPTMAWGNRPMLPHVMRQGTDDSPNREIQEMARQMEVDGALCASFFTGFPHADIRLAGSSAVVVTDGDIRLAEHLRDQLLDLAWSKRHAFVYEIEPLEESLRRATVMEEEGPIILLDHYDNAASGGSMDTMAVLKAILDAELEEVAVFAICDPDAVEYLISVGIGNEVSLLLGGRTDMPSIGLIGEPLEVSGRVRLISDGRFRNIGPMGKGVMNNMGPTVVLDTGKVEIVVVSTQQEPNDFACFHSLGIDPLAKRFIMLKSRIHWRAGFREIASQVIDCAGVGVCTSDYSTLDFKNVRRPVFPLDEELQPVSTR